MKIALPKPAAAVALCLLVAQQGVAHADPTRMTVNSGDELRVVFASSEKPDCTFAAMPVIHVVKDPAHGRLRLQAEMGRPSFDADNPRYFCNKWRIKGVSVYYMPNEGFAGDDSITLHFDFGGGDEMMSDYIFTVR